MQKITSHLWFDNQAEEAMNYYVETFNGNPKKSSESKILNITYYPENSEEEHLKGMNGKVINGRFELDGVEFQCLDGGPLFKFNESVSFLVECDGQEEVDYYWEKLSAVPESEQCGWCKDKYGLSWQIIPKQLGELMNQSDPEKAKAVTHCMMQQHKIVISELEAAAK